MSTNYVWPDAEIPAIKQDGEYKALAAAIVEKWSRGKSLRYVMPDGRDDKVLYMGLKPLLAAAGFASIRIRHEKGADGKNVQENGRDVYLLFPKPKDQETAAAPALVPATPLLLRAPATA